ncbi:dihydrolipoamide acetyltransferase family protein [Metabacillus sediminilitoris]|uniref:Dihydrolipoamide acetyltransferase component of pyruvate dehydrogenase complex n=1 Tax=Metabacillus sediminilitoris TaxID=2567941 RepID=A0A4S4BQT3_9BACI|nr:dihydrolipoamide acetyltransferase family protein [Metabacillus sediminilitoris]QGQ45136.1 2-oxo acid dehydrogenase subunit E2 [Metabacillus sediminilitoris]THF76502.1 2-oxo acid dehydrogenase subunit E2 [Metabacillus sediminilitoris]
MATEVVMPKLGATMEEGTIVSWLVQVGETVEEGDPIAEIQTDKIVLEIEAETTGVLLKTLYDAGTVVKVHENIAYLGEENERVEDLEKQTPTASLQSAEAQRPGLAEESTIQSRQLETGSKIRRTPAARKLAEDNQLDLRMITGSGPLGRIQKMDVENYLARPRQKITPLAKKVADDQGIDIHGVTGTGTRGKIVKDDIVSISSIKTDETQQIVQAEKRVPFKGMRKVIADRISSSAYTAPHVTLLSEIDMTKCVALRKDLLPVIEKEEGLRVSFNDILMKATAFALKQHPGLNISLEGNEIVYHSNIHIGMAVAVSDGLVVPVLRDVDQKGLAVITREAKTIGKQARDGKLSPDDMQGSTFTISNLGMYAVDGFTPIINAPNAAILGVGRIQEKPVIVNGEVAVRSMMNVSLSFDHRIIDGAPAAAFLTDLKDTLENPFKLMI